MNGTRRTYQDEDRKTRTTELETATEIPRSKLYCCSTIRVDVPHLTKFDVGGVQRWRGVRHWGRGVALMHSVSRGIDAAVPRPRPWLIYFLEVPRDPGLHRCVTGIVNNVLHFIADSKQILILFSHKSGTYHVESERPVTVQEQDDRV